MRRQSRLLTGGLWVTGGRMVAAVAAAVGNILLARLLSPRDLGQYFFAISVGVVTVTLAQLGLLPTAVRGVAAAVGVGDHGLAHRVVGDVMRWGLIGILVVGVVLFALAGVIGFQVSAVLLVIAWMATRTWQSLLAEVLRGFHNIRAATLYVGAVSSVVSSGVLAVLWVAHRHVDLNAALGVMVFGGGVSALLASLEVHRHLKRRAVPPGGDASGVTPHVLAQSWPVLINNLSWLALLQADVWILSVFRPPVEVAVYGIASRLTRLLSELQLISRSVVSPRIAELHVQVKRSELEHLLRDTSRLVGTLALAAFVVLVVAGDELLGRVYGDVYRAGYPALLLLGLGQLVSACAGVSATVLLMTGHQHVVMVVSVVCGVATMAGSLLLVQAYGMTGVAVAVGLGMIFQNIIMWWVTGRRLGMWTHIRLKRV